MWFVIRLMGFILLTYSIIQKIFNIYPESFLTWFVIGSVLLATGIIGSTHNTGECPNLIIDTRTEK